MIAALSSEDSIVFFCNCLDITTWWKFDQSWRLNIAVFFLFVSIKNYWWFKNAKIFIGFMMFEGQLGHTSSTYDLLHLVYVWKCVVLLFSKQLWFIYQENIIPKSLQNQNQFYWPSTCTHMRNSAVWSSFLVFSLLFCSNVLFRDLSDK